MERIISIEGMSCMHCAERVNKALSSLNEVEKVEVHLEQKNAVVTLHDNIEDEDLINAVKEAGYEVTSIEGK